MRGPCVRMLPARPWTTPRSLALAVGLTPYADVRRLTVSFTGTAGVRFTPGVEPQMTVRFSWASRLGNLALAVCVEANANSRIVPAARGTIFTYGLDGVCHQLPTESSIPPGPETLSLLPSVRPHGYMASVFISGTYGLQEAAWRESNR